jgi:hypothetical protein
MAKARNKPAVKLAHAALSPENDRRIATGRIGHVCCARGRALSNDWEKK